MIGAAAMVVLIGCKLCLTNLVVMGMTDFLRDVSITSSNLSNRVVDRLFEF
jgi:hypothetical protein